MTEHIFYGVIGSQQTNQKESNMSLSSHLSELRKKHESLSDKINFEQNSPGSDDLTVAALKKTKLQLKDEIARIAGQV